MHQYFKNSNHQPFWWDAAPPHESDQALPEKADVVIIGTGFTGASAALTLSRGGLQVIALDSQEIGFGASTRNGGQIGPGNQKFTVQQLVDMFGKQKALRIYQEGNQMLSFFKDLIKVENIDCDLTQCGRFRGAITNKHYDSIAREFEAAQRFADTKGFVVTKQDIYKELESDEYVGGLVLTEDGSVHPGRFHHGLVEKAKQSGAKFFSHTPVIGYQNEKRGFQVQTLNQRSIKTQHIIVATNGYIVSFGDYFKRKIIPVASAIIATEPLPEDLITRILPQHRVYGETRRVINYFRTSPDRKRILFGGRCFKAHQEVLSPYKTLYKYMLDILPGLKGAKISHCWSGYVGITENHFPHIGVHQGIHYAMGYSGTGVTRATYFGHKIALRLLGDKQGFTEFDDIPFNDHGLLSRITWMRNSYIRWLHIQDLMDEKRR